VRDAFAENFRDRGDVGAGVAVVHDGRVVVDLVGGHRDRDGSVPYDRDALQLVFSTTKGLTAVCVGVCIQRGWLAPDQRVRDLWPELPADVTVEQLMSHQAGLITVEPPLRFEEVLDWARVVKGLEGTTPEWEPGTAHGYHAITYGWLAGELVRRSDPQHRSLGRFFAEEVVAPLGLEAWIGLPAALEPRVARLLGAPPPTDPELVARMLARSGPGTRGYRALTMSGAFPMTGKGLPWNRPEVRAAEIPGANGITNARSLARLYGSLVSSVDGVRLLEAGTVDELRRARVAGPDACLLDDTSFGVGFMLDTAFNPLLSPGSLGHPGAGGSLGFADPEAGVGFGYVMNQMQQGLAADPRQGALIEAVRTCL
jgi:CubicO group peptidase (beta-lactamase class C family)